ncbi:lysophospholipid acyltransferase family protein [Zoogloea sp.]|uniref:lysophospholipid acyltransferase family protein n=1 Tax=Zoogloea sp. TaxID=49181 RepID=UPI001AD083DF|nr:lysophospholipid acyltransferase family protein [Zoogloea sp.]MBN8282346.1 1-acyl-sn-glycerol-3-phosphate acyltransferase [Zoogloea sp.]HRH75259.1 lysophospholipid acyltransferase family protein [Zoogloea sp.]
MVLIRNLLFMLALAVFTPLYALIGMASFPFGPKTRHKLIRGWPRIMAWVIKHVLGIPYRVIGRENIPVGPAIVVSKHMSAWETIMLQDIFPPMVFVMKKEIHKVPFFGWGISQMPMIAIDRAAGKDALTQVEAQGRDRLAHGFWVTIFPEGTRVAPGSKKRYKAGASWLAAQTGTPVVPVAHNAGEFWPRNAFFKRPGEVVVSVGPVIDTTGLTAEEINARAEAWVEGEMRRLFPHHYRTSRSKEASTA